MWWESKDSAFGEIEKYPPISGSSSAQNELSESNLGRQHQSIEPDFEISAALRELPIIP